MKENVRRPESPVGDTRDFWCHKRSRFRAKSRTIHHKSQRRSYACVMANQGRPREFGDRVTKALRLDPELDQRLKSAARERDVSVNLLINRAVEEYLERLPAVDRVLASS